MRLVADANILNLLGLARRGGNLTMGEEPVADVCQLHKARVVFLASDAGDTICRRAARMADTGNAPLVTLPWSKAEIGFHLGRSACALLAVTDQGLASAVITRLAQSDERLKELAESMSEKTARQKVRRDQKKKLQAKQGSAKRN